MARWTRPGINLNMSDKTAEFAGMQYMIDKCGTGYRSIIVDQLRRLVYSRFKWYGPTNAEAHALEWALVTGGQVGIVRSKLDLMAQTPGGVFVGAIGQQNPEIDFYGNPLSVVITGLNGKTISATKQDDFVVGYDSMAHTNFGVLVDPYETKINNYATLIDNALQMWIVAAETRKSGMVFQVATERQKKFLEKVLSKISGNSPYIVVLGDVSGVNTQANFAPSNTDALKDYHDYLLNCIGWALDDLGLENQPQQKQERLVVTEAKNNRNLSRYIGADSLLARKAICDELREKGIADWEVEFYLDSVGEESMNEANEEGDANNALL